MYWLIEKKSSKKKILSSLNSSTSTWAEKIICLQCFKKWKQNLAIWYAWFLLTMASSLLVTLWVHLTLSRAFNDLFFFITSFEMLQKIKDLLDFTRSSMNITCDAHFQINVDFRSCLKMEVQFMPHHALGMLLWGSEISIEIVTPIEKIFIFSFALYFSESLISLILCQVTQLQAKL